ncbi:unnamed protein product, partial [Ectocarpus sp. 6 AP-2014]
TTTTTTASGKEKLQRGGSGGAETATGEQKKEKAERKAAPASRAGEMGRFWAASTLLQESLACNYTAGAEIVLDTMSNEGLWATTSTYNTFLWYFRQERDAKGALSMLQSLRE